MSPSIIGTGIFLFIGIILGFWFGTVIARNQSSIIRWASYIGVTFVMVTVLSFAAFLFVGINITFFEDPTGNYSMNINTGGIYSIPYLAGFIIGVRRTRKKLAKAEILREESKPI